MLTFTTRAPASTAATIPAARSALVMEPEAVTRTGMIGVAPATPRPPMPFPSIALTRPAMNVPWPRVSCVRPPAQDVAARRHATGEVGLVAVDARVDHRDRVGRRPAARRRERLARPHRPPRPSERPPGRRVEGVGGLGVQRPGQVALDVVEPALVLERIDDRLAVAAGDGEGVQARQPLDRRAGRVEGVLEVGGARRIVGPDHPLHRPGGHLGGRLGRCGGGARDGERGEGGRERGAAKGHRGP